MHNTKGKTKWLCICECGNLTEVELNHLTRNNSKSCGCFRIKHDKSNIRLYNIWGNIKQRCYNKNNHGYKNYGGRGVAVCSEWLEDFQAFYDWSMVNGYADNLTIDRIDVNGNYEPSNCRWVDRKQQSRNRRNIKLITYKGETRPLVEWCELLNLDYQNTYKRLYKLK